MIAVDTNLLVYAHRREARLGDQAHRLMAGLAVGDRPWAIPWPCCFEFLSVVTSRRLWKDTATTPGAGMAPVPCMDLVAIKPADWRD